MVRLEAVFQAGLGMSPEIAAKLSQRASKYQSDILLKCGERELRLDSLIGILSMEMPRGSRVTVVAEGPDEAAAAEDIRGILIGG